MKRLYGGLLVLTMGAGLTVAFAFGAGQQPGTKVQAPAKKRPCQDLSGLVKGIYDRLDTSGKGYFTRNDVDRALMNHAIKGRDAHALYVLRSHFNEFAKTPAPGKVANVSQKVPRVTLADLENFDKTLQPAALAQSVDEQMESAATFLAKVNRKLYPTGTEAESLKKMRSVGQVWRGNCYLLSGYGSLAALEPERVRKMIKDNGPDKRGVRTFTVTFARAPNEEYVVDELSDAALMINEVQEDTGIWVAILVRAYGEYLRAHPESRTIERFWHKLDLKELAEDMTDEGSMNHEGLRMMTDPSTTRVLQYVWDIDANNMRPYFGDLSDFLQKYAVKPFLDKRDPAVLHKRLKESICDGKLPATVLKYGGGHEASIIDYRPGKKSPDGKHESQYGFVTVRDQAGLSDAEEKSIKAGTSWREDGMDDKTICLPVEEYCKLYSGFACVVKR